MPMIQLTEQEQQIANAIKDFAALQSPPTTPRFAGGWVRDKIMGVPSHDIDVALDNVSGYAFALGLSRTLSNMRLGGATDQPDTPSVHKIQANPDKSKHLETAVVSICGVSVDFAHLRSETYTNTRIPEIQPGTPREDAMRRDLTINALFYNLNTGEVEDYTGSGLRDIQGKVIRTPLDPRITLREDPLRILRIFRFKAKLGFAIDRSVYDALALPEIACALRCKVTSERIEAEVFKMLDYEKGHVGMLEIIKTGYIPAVFSPAVDREINLPLSLQLFDKCKEFVAKLHARCVAIQQEGMSTDREPAGQNRGPHDARCLDIGEVIWRRTDVRIIWLYMALHNYLGVQVGQDRRMEYANVVVLRESLKSSRQRTMHVRRIEECVAYLCDKDNVDLTRLALFCGEHLFETLLICAATERRMDAEKIALDLICRNLYDCHRVSAVVTGNDLKSLDLPAMGYRGALVDCLVYQIDHPHATKAEILASLAICRKGT